MPSGSYSTVIPRRMRAASSAAGSSGKDAWDAARPANLHVRVAILGELEYDEGLRAETTVQRSSDGIARAGPGLNDKIEGVAA